MDQENIPQPSGTQSSKAPEIPGSSRLGSKFRSAGYVIGVIAILSLFVFVATHLPAIRSAWAGLVEKPQSLAPSASSPVHRAAMAAPVTSESLAPGAPVQNAILSQEEQAHRIWTEFEKASLGVSFDDWSRQHSEIPCRRFNGTMWSPTADAAWAERCTTGTQPEDAHWLFYIFGQNEQGVVRLGQFDVSTASLPADSLTALHGLLQSRLAARFGPGEDTSPKVGHTRDSAWPPNLRWQTADAEIQIFLSELDPSRKVGRLRVQARGRALLDALKDDEHLKQFAAGNFLYQAGSGIDVRLAEKLKSEFPGPAAMLVKQQPDTAPEKVKEALDQWKQQFSASHAAGQSGVRAGVIAIPQSNWNAKEFEAAIVQLVRAAKSAPVDRQPVLLLAADRLAGRLTWVSGNDKSSESLWPEWRSQLHELGIDYGGSEASPYPTAWIYTGSLLKRVASEYGQTDWGEHAFALLIAQGFDNSEDCATGTDQFRAVISQGVRFLETHPSSLYRLDVQIAVAQGYETWWSLSQAPAPTESEDDYSTVEAAQYRKGAEAARQQAIAGYEVIVQASPQSDHAVYARRQLPRLKLGADTGQRRYYCEVGD